MKKSEVCELSDKSLAILATTCICVGLALLSCVVYSLTPSPCQHSGERRGTGQNSKVSLSGTFHLVSSDNHYKDYLLAMDIPLTAVDIITRSSETVIIKTLSPTEDRISMRTVTSKMKTYKMVKIQFIQKYQLFLEWSTRDTEFKLNTPFNVTYGLGEDRGVLYNYCDRPGENIIHCSSDDPKKDWRFEFQLIFSVDGLINKRHFVTKDIAMQKTYQREINKE